MISGNNVVLLKICLGEWRNESRDKRELSVCQELGMKTIVVAKGGKTGVVEDVDGFQVYRISTRPVKQLPVSVNRILSMFTWAWEVRKMDVDIISGHDMVACIIAVMSNLGKSPKKRAKLVYDSHEFEFGRNAERSELQRWGVKLLESYILHYCEFAIMVNDSIADEVQRIYKLKKRPVVVRSTPENWKLDMSEIQRTRSEILNALNLSEETFILMYHGGVMSSRNIEALIRAVSRNDGTSGLIVGNDSDGSYLQKLKDYAKELGVEDRVYFQPAVSHSILPNYVGASNVGMILHKNYAKNAQYSLPNKFFENIQAMTPLISTDMELLRNYIEKYGIGEIVDINDDASVDAAISKMRTDKSMYESYKKNLLVAKEELCWEKEKVPLISAYSDIGGGYFVIMYHGAIMNDRGIENMLRVIERTKNTVGLFVGDAASDDYKKKLEALVRELRIENRVLFHPAVPHEELYRYIGAADVSMYIGLGRCLSYYYALPNKFFESIQSLSPQIVSNFPELRRLTEQYEIGLTVDPENLDEIQAAVERMQMDHGFYNQCKDNLVKAKTELCWEKEKVNLQEAYRRLI